MDWQCATGLKIRKQVLKITGVLVRQGIVRESPGWGFFNMLRGPFEIRIEIGSEKELSRGKSLGCQERQEGWLNQSPFVMLMLGPRIRKHHVGVVD